MTLSDVAEQYLTDRRACQNCGEAVHSLNGKTWFHTTTGGFRCTPSADRYVGGDGFADPHDEAVDEAKLEEADYEGHSRGYEEGKEIGYEEGEADGLKRGREEGEKDGRAEAERDMHDAVRSYLNELSPEEIAELPAKVRDVFKGVWDATKLEHG